MNTDDGKEDIVDRRLGSDPQHGRREMERDCIVRAVLAAGAAVPAFVGYRITAMPSSMWMTSSGQ